MGVFECKMSKYSILISSRELKPVFEYLYSVVVECFQIILGSRSAISSLLSLSLRCTTKHPISPNNRNRQGTLGFPRYSTREFFRHEACLTIFNRNRSGHTRVLPMDTEYCIRELWFHNPQVFTILCIQYSRRTRELWFHNRQVFTVPCIQYSHSTRELQLWFHNRQVFCIHIYTCSVRLFWGLLSDL